MINKTPPNDSNSEMSILGAVILDNEKVHKINLADEVFYQKKHQIIWKAIKHKIDKGDPVDATTLRAKLDKDNNLDFIGGLPYIMELMNSPAHEVEHYASILTKCFLKRQLLLLASKIEKNVFSGQLSTSEVIDGLHRELDVLSKDSTNEEFVSGKDLLDSVLEDIENGGEKVNGQSTGFKKLDYVIDGLIDGELMTIGAASGVGKSAMAVAIISHLITTGHKPAIFNLEMTNKGVMRRLLSFAANVCGRRLKNGDINESEWKKVSKAVGDLGKSEYFLSDNPYLNLSQIMSQARKLVRDKGVDSIWIDHMGLVQRDKGFVGEERLWLGEVANSLKRLGKELNVPIVMLSQLKQKEYSSSQLPAKNDLHGSKMVYEACDKVIMIHRDELDEPVERQDALFIIRKNREGNTGIIKVNFFGSTTKFSEGDSL